MDKPFAITLDPGSSLADKTGAWRTERPAYVHRPAPCGHACPAGEDVQGWLYHAEEGAYERAWRLIMEDNPLPAVMGRVCYHPCETASSMRAADPAGMYARRPRCAPTATNAASNPPSRMAPSRSSIRLSRWSPTPRSRIRCTSASRMSRGSR